jgi:uncharacterized protein (DUF58 family)
MRSPGAGADLDLDQLLRLRHLAFRMRNPRIPPRSALPGGIVHRRRGRGLEVHDIRVWSDGDDIRHLDRNATARTGVPHVRTFRDERERTALLVADFRPSMLFGTRRALRSVAAGEALALLGWRTIGEGGRVGLVAATPDGTHFARQGRGNRAMISLIGELAEAHRAAMASPGVADRPLAAVLDEAEELAGTGATLIVATGLDTPGDRFDDVAERLARQHDLCVVLVEDRFERAPPPGAYPYMTVDGDAGWIRIGSTAAPVRPDGRAAWLRRLGARVVRLDSGLGAEAMAGVLEQLDG